MSEIKAVENCAVLTPEEKKIQLFLNQKHTLDMFLERGAISQAQYDRVSEISEKEKE